MTRHDFIFSDQRRYRVARHVTFWIVWCLAFNILFHFPIHVFKGWDLSGPGTRNYQELGPILFFIKSLVVNSLFGVIVPQILLTYVVIDWLLPNYFYKKRNPFLVASITLGILIIFYFVATGFKYSPSIYNKIAGMTPGGFATYFATRHIVLIDQASSLPIVLGMALLIKLVKRWWEKQKQTEQLSKEKTKAELQLLKAQVHPHFLFNTINNIYYFTLNHSAQAPVMIKKLSGLLNYILNECEQPMVPLENELKMIQNYMELEKIRYSDHMQMTIDIRGDYEGKLIAPLLLIPFLENSFKHGASRMITQPWVNLCMKIENGRLNFNIKNSKPVIEDEATTKARLTNPPDQQTGRQGNIGLKNVKKRLELLYPANHELNIIDEPGCYTVSLDMKLYDVNENNKHINELKPQHEYAVA